MVVRRYLYRSDAAVVGVILRRSSQFSDWVNPYLPEDLHFLRADDSLVLGSVAQHGDAWLELSPVETSRLASEAPGLLERVRAATRRLSDAEAHIIDKVAEGWGAHRNAAALRSQLPHLRVVVGHPVTSMQFSVDGDPPPINLSDGLLPVDANVLDETGRETGRIQLWIVQGRLAGLEYSWWTDEQPMRLPDPKNLNIVSSS